MPRLLVLTAMTALLLAACATPDEREHAVRQEKVYRTGSNLPVRDPGERDRVLGVKPDVTAPTPSMPPPGAVH